MERCVWGEVEEVKRERSEVEKERERWRREE